ncbi:MAG TPA: peptidylprolyl isomerase [Methanocella sp.]|uniref:FKBP-type peptidyl-prolyl cis-trans isomerase n=1 Tax=Methanocella sp. TaxID=2052833 RepID=UPI002C19A6C3|nr:peptidylprolyl isomerase [Methanocella sp.]HTY91377.1 peptidylprolyl isomerase [Methanocella sp.]
MAITKGDIIKLSFTGKLDNGSVFDTTDADVAKQNEIYDEKRTYEPMTVVVGSNTLVQGLEEDLPGKKKGHKGTVTVPPEKGYGFRSLELIETVSTKKFDKKPEPGAWIESDGRVGVIESVSGGRVRVDYNEPLAGKTLTFDYRIEDVLEDKGEKTDAIIHGYIGPEAKYETVGDTITIDVPKEYYLSEEWAIGKVLIARFLTSFVGYRHVTYKETFDESDLAEKSE